jgi:hypothetical protein
MPPTVLAHGRRNQSRRPDRRVGLVVFGVPSDPCTLIEKNQELWWPVPVLLGFTFFMGSMLSRMIGTILGF